MRLTLADELLLLALREQDGRALIGSAELDCGLAGALLAELALAERVRLVGGRIRAVDPSPLGDPDLDALLQRIVADRRARKPERWVDRTRRDDVRKRRLARLAEIGVLEARDHRFLFFKHTTYSERDPRYEQELRARLRAVMEGAPADGRAGALLAIVHACGLDRKAFREVNGRLLRRRVKEVTKDEWAGQAVAKAIASTRASVSAATTAAAMSSSRRSTFGG